jgi:hypothetical protein
LKNKLILCLFMSLPLTVRAQWYDDLKPAVQPRLMAGADFGAFRISLKDFEDMYTSRWGTSLGGFIGVRAFAVHYIMFKYGTFDKSGRQAGADGVDFSDARWREQWYKIGLRVHPVPNGKWGSYYGFGISFYNIKETEGLSIFTLKNKDASREIGSGFYLDAGIDYFMRPEVALFFDVEIASGGTSGRTGFEAMSIGGWRFAGGISFWPF